MFNYSVPRTFSSGFIGVDGVARWAFVPDYVLKLAGAAVPDCCRLIIIIL